MPLLHDPSCPGTRFNLQDTDDQAAIVAWQKQFGPEFASDEVTAERASIVEAKALRASGAPEKASAAEPGRPARSSSTTKAKVERRYEARIDAAILGTYTKSLREARVVRVGQKLRFRLRTDVPEPYEVWWKVRNRGPAAERASQLRGRIFHHGSEGRNEHRESASYPGSHYVEAYVVRNGIVVASIRIATSRRNALTVDNQQGAPVV